MLSTVRGILSLIYNSPHLLTGKRKGEERGGKREKGGEGEEGRKDTE